jgi:hypothetical protein
MGTEKHVFPDTADMLSNRVKKSMKESRGENLQKTIYGPNNEPLSIVDMEIGHDLTKTGAKKEKSKSPNPFGV